MERVVNRAFRYRPHSTAEQASILMEWADAKRFVWNKALGLCDTRLSSGHAVPRYAQMSRMLTLWKQAEE